MHERQSDGTEDRKARLPPRNAWRQAGRWLRLRTTGLAALLVVFAAAAAALDPATAPADYGRQTWTIENGLPQNTVQALAQTPDGFLWLGTEAGLVRFDGVAFETHPIASLPGSDIRTLLVARDGALWIGTNAGLARWKDGALRKFSTQDGLPAGGILSLGEDSGGAMRVETELGAVRRQDGRFVPDGDNHTFPRNAFSLPEAVAFAARTPEGVFAGGKTALEFLPRGRNGKAALRLEVGRELPGSRIQSVLADREGALWIGTDAGLVRWKNGKLARFPVTDPLSAASILAIVEDHEGDLWVGTETGGLQILRDQRFRTLEALASARLTAVVEDRAGDLWVGTQEDGLDLLGRRGEDARWRLRRRFTVENGMASDVILSLAAASNGDLWVGTPDGLNRIRAGRVQTFTSADGLPDDFIRSLLVDEDGSLWIGTRRGLTHWRMDGRAAGGVPPAARIETYTQANGLGSDLVGAMTRDAGGDLWVATLAGLARLRGPAITNFTTANGLSSNVVTALVPRSGGGLWIGTQDRGWNLWDGRRFHPVEESRLRRTAVHALLDDGAGSLWLATGDGIALCDTSATNPADCARWIEFGAADGLPSREMAVNSHPSAWRARDGRLWFATLKGLVEVNPAHFPVNTLPPPVAIERFKVDDRDQPLGRAGTGLKVPAGRVHFEFDYDGLSYVAPQKVRYRYKLVGFDRGWTEAGSRRAAYYTNIPPGRYTFRVQAANNDGLWNTTGAALGFELRPRFDQTLWFYGLLLAALGGTVVLFLRMRLLAAEREFKAVLGERSRIAREIHDTLAQGYAGVSVQLEVLAALLRQHKVNEAAQQLDKTREVVRHGLADARQSIWALRTQDAGETTLPVRLRRLADEAADSGLTPEFSLFGAYRPLPAETEREIVRVAQEAIHNVKKHARARRLWVQLEYAAETVALEVRDDGQGGVSEETIGAAPGSFGLTGIKERAAAIGGVVQVASEPGMGTSIRLSAPARASAGARGEVQTGR